jgi:alkanesulfonate monooxygenase SsuD/methylene tetrahydromethanopterin reductase-like flavin-dependent oxidoreductase (luciferase family)
MRFGIVILPQDPWPIARRKWQSTEGLGFDHAWTYDHLSWRSLADEPWHATVPTLTAAAAATESIKLGTFVTSPNFRHPVPFAKDIATVDDIAGGRFLLGIGSGGTGFDAFVLGERELTAGERHRRYVEFVELLDKLLRFEPAAASSTNKGTAPDAGTATDTGTTNPGISYTGDWYTAHNARMVGEPAQRPRMPFVLAANGPKALDLVGQFGQGWVTFGPDDKTGDAWWSVIAERAARLDDAAVKAGRHPKSIDRYLNLDSDAQYSLESVGAFDDLVGRAAELGFTDVISHWPRTAGIYAGNEDVLYEVAANSM